MKFIFVADLFAEDYEGGAELTTQALIECSKIDVIKIRSKDISIEFLQNYQNNYWIFGNFSGMDFNLIPAIINNINYSILEYDYKFCRYRSIEKHKIESGQNCDCAEQSIGKYVSAFYYAADHVFWMSVDQRDRYFSYFPQLKNRNHTVLSSIFNKEFFKLVDTFKLENNNRNGWIVLGSNSWIKGKDDAIKWCHNNDKSYEVVWNIPYKDMLIKLASAEGFVYMPLGGDTCPRMVIEAKLLGCNVIVNQNVQHSNENWWQSSLDNIYTYLKDRPKIFWSIIEKYAKRDLTVSGYTTTYNCISQNYPFMQSITSMINCLDEVIVVDSGSDDGTWIALQKMTEIYKNLKIYQHVIDFNDERYAYESDGKQKSRARSFCTGDMCWQMDVDEIIHEKDYIKIKSLAGSLLKSHQVVALPMLEFWGNKGKIRIDVNPWKWRLSRNYPHITHGIPSHLRKIDKNGKIYAMKGTDSCDYIHSETGELIPFVSFHTHEIDQLRHEAQISQELRSQYAVWFKMTLDKLPGVYHYSWFDLIRKIKTYKNFWSKFWLSMYNIKQEDISENNMFFDKAWSEVSDEEIDKIAIRLEKEMGGWIFHHKIDWNKPTPSIKFEDITHPIIMNNWIGEI